MSVHTKEALAQSFSIVLEKKAFDKIKVSDITDTCGVNRQTFYYHFHDIYELVEWIYLSHAEKVMGDGYHYENWQQGLLTIFHMMSDNKNFIEKTNSPHGYPFFETMLLKKAEELLIRLVREVDSDYHISPEDEKFIADFYKYSYVGVIEEWVSTGMKEEPEVLVDKIDSIMQGNLLSAVKRLQITEK